MIPRNSQEFIHWLEAGAGAHWVRRFAVVALVLLGSLFVANKQFHGPSTETTLVQADMGRQLARGEGFTTLVNYPQTAAFLRARGVAFDATQPYPEIHHAPLYSMVIAAVLKLTPGSIRDGLFSKTPVPPDGFGADYLLLGLSLALLWLAAWLTFKLACRLFDERVGWLASLAVLLSVSLWQHTVLVNGTTLMMVLVLLVFHVWVSVENDFESSLPTGWLVALGAGCGLLFLTEYSSGALLLVAIAYTLWRAGPRFGVAVALVVLGFAVIAGPWIVRNLRLTGSPVGLAAQNVALKFGDPTAEPATVRATLSAELPAIDLNKLGNKTLTSLQDNLKSRLWSGGALCFTAFFVAGSLYTFRSPAANRLRWVCVAAVGVLLVSQAALNSGESERLVAVWCAPLIILFGAGFFFVLLSANATLVQSPRWAAAVLLVVQALPLLHDALEPRRMHFQYPPYFPGLLQGMKFELTRREAVGRFGLMADIPAGLAWYGGARVWAQPSRMRDFHAIMLEQPVGELLLTPRTLDRPFFSELNARAQPAAPLQAVPNRYGEWGEVYAGLLTGAPPREFPLRSPERLAENLYVLLNPSLPPVRQK